MQEKQITVTSPLLPDLDELREMMEDIWARHWVTNLGEYHQLLEAKLAEYLKVPYIILFTNGTIPLITALQALEKQKLFISWQKKQAALFIMLILQLPNLPGLVKVKRRLNAFLLIIVYFVKTAKLEVKILQFFFLMKQMLLLNFQMEDGECWKSKLDLIKSILPQKS